MRLNIEDLIDDYLSSQHYMLINGEIKEHAEIILNGFASFFKGLKETGPNLPTLEKALETLSSLSLPVQVKKEIPDLLCSFFSSVAQSGRFPEGTLWEEAITALKPGFLRKFRDDGSMRGETFKKRYTDVGRNDPCPCGSGLKFKKCCMKIIS